MLVTEKIDSVRAAACSFEAALPSGQRKMLGQFFTGLPLGKLLAHLALSPDTRTILDPMVGHGDLLDATWEGAIERSINLDRLDGIEIDAPTAAHCQHRLAQIIGEHKIPRYHILTSSAFDQAVQLFFGERKLSRTFDFIDDGKFRGRQGRQRETAFAGRHQGTVLLY